MARGRGDKLMYQSFLQQFFLCSGDTGVTVTALVPTLCFPLHAGVAHRTFIACSSIYFILSFIYSFIFGSLLLAYIMFKNVLDLVAKLKNRSPSLKSPYF